MQTVNHLNRDPRDNRIENLKIGGTPASASKRTFGATPEVLRANKLIDRFQTRTLIEGRCELRLIAVSSAVESVIADLRVICAEEGLDFEAMVCGEIK
jgi:hypothetical protein